jgi:alkanesulfonate monooxygenase SsuD/methylene tetrahydromethanopterin reductase-like flavin-dependent oxidoreductase (luciferase family)
MALAKAADAQQQRSDMFASNPFKIGLFGANLSSGRTATTVPERWSGDWLDCLEMAKIADDGGIDFLLPVGRWKGYGGASDFHGGGLETITWATGLLAHTKRVTVFGTVHAPLFHPLVAAKQMVTADQVGGGRFGLNIVAGWNQDEFEMFGIEQRPHDERYVFAEEWLDVMMKAWTSPEPFDYDGKYFKLRKVMAKPKPFGPSRPLIMNAGASGAGQTFAMRNCDAFFTTITNAGATKAEGGYARNSDILMLENTAKRVAGIKDDAKKYGRNIEVYTQGQVVCRPTQSEAEDYYRWANIDNADWPAIDRLLELNKVSRENTLPDEYESRRLTLARSGIGGRPYVGSPDRVAEELGMLAKAGIRGIAVSFVNYVRDVPYFCAEVLPRLRKMGFRTN